MIDKNAILAIIKDDETTGTRGVFFFNTNAGTEITYNSTKYCRAKRPLSGGSKKPRRLSRQLRQPGKGCFFMATSKLQEETKNRLRILFKGYDFIENYRPDWLRNPESGRPLEFDFWLPENQIAIEVQGQQHYEYIPYFHGSLENFERQLKRDELKRQVCQEKGIYFYEIFGSEDIDQFLDEASKHSQELSIRLKAKSLAIRELGFCAAQLWMEDRKKPPNTAIQDELIQRMANLAREHQLTLKEVQPDFNTRKIDLQFSDHPVVGITVIGPMGWFHGVKVLVLSITDKEIHIKLARPKRFGEFEGGIFSAKTGRQDESGWAIRPDCLDKIRIRYTDHQNGRVR